MLGAGYLFLLSVEIVVDRIAHAATMHSLACCQAPLVACEHTTAHAHEHTHNELAPSSPGSDTCDELLEAQPNSVGRHLLEQVPCGQDAALSSPPHLAVCASHAGLSGDRKRRPFAAFAATCGLSVHALLEGMALGFRRSSSDFAVICVTIAVHKSFAALALGAVLTDRPDWLRRAATLAFCMATPVGIAVGSALLASTSCTVTAPLGAFSAGSLVWVALHEVISPATQRNSVLPVLCATWLGFGAMTALAIWV
jgi:zinc transporter ZupT